MPPSTQSLSHAATASADSAAWADIVQQLGAEIAGPLSQALERIHTLIATGQIDRQSLRALREGVSQAREAGMMGQQLARLASGKLRLSKERLQLTQMLRGVLAHRSREALARGIQIRQVLKPADVLGDGALLFALLNALLDWALACTHSSVDFRLDLSPWPARARLSCRFAHRSLDLVDDTGEEELPAALNSLAWRLLEQTALTMGLQPLREHEAGITELTLEFPHTLLDEPGAPQPEPKEGWGMPDAREFANSSNSKPLAGSHLLIVSPRRELRGQIQDAVRHMGLIIDVVNTMAEAQHFCMEGLPHAVIFESSQRGSDLEALRTGIVRDVADFCFIEVQESAHHTQLSSATADGMARIARSNLAEALPAMLLFELSKSL